MWLFRSCFPVHHRSPLRPRIGNPSIMMNALDTNRYRLGSSVRVGGRKHQSSNPRTLFLGDMTPRRVVIGRWEAHWLVLAAPPNLSQTNLART